MNIERQSDANEQQRIEHLEAQLAAANARLQVAKDALEAVEWVMYFVEKCPWCETYAYRNNHAPNCKRQLALAAIVEKEEK